MRYVGRSADADAGIVTKKWAENAHAARMADSGYVTSTLAQAILDGTLQPLSYATSQDLLRATTSVVAAADALHADASLRNHPTSGVAGLNASGILDPSHLPVDVTTDRVVTAHAVTPENTFLTGDVVTSSTAFRDKRLATITVPDPGYPWTPLPFATVTGRSGDSLPPEGYWGGNGVCGLLTAAPASGDRIYGRGVCTDSLTSAPRHLLPGCDAGATPLNAPAVEGGLTLNLYGACFQGTGYVFSSSSEFQFLVYVLPAT